MRSVYWLGLAVVFAVPTLARAEDGGVDASTLAALGLGNMESMSDAEGAAVRGRVLTSSFAIGTVFFSYQISDPAGVLANSFVQSDMQSNMNPTTVNVVINFPGLVVTPPPPDFSASISAFSITSIGTIMP